MFRTSVSRVARTSLLSSLAVGLIVASGCGWRTGLDNYDDGSIPGRDGGALDGGRDAGIDVGPIVCRTPADCSDGRLCNGVEECVGGTCRPGTPFMCDDGVGCTLDSCDDRVGCVFDPNDGICGPGARCDAFVGCIPGGGGCRFDEECNDGDVCNGEERCAPDSGLCVGGDPIACPLDPFECTVERCDADFGCIVSIDNTLCPPGTLCNVMAGCIAIDCGSDAACDDGDPCNGRETCSAGRCRAGAPLNCDDGNACTMDRCQAFAGCVSTVGREACFDMLDNDCNGLTDCEDPVCRSLPACVMCTPVAPIEFRCTDGRDDDCDGLFDCADPECGSDPSCGGCMPIADSEVFCSDGGDDDCDGFFDCMDFDCTGRPECGCVPIAMREVRCGDGLDDDCDGNIDCADSDCAGPACGCVPTAMTETNCRNRIDEDCDGRIDCADPDCSGRPICMGACVPTGANEIGVAQCTNGRDDDCDGRLDCADPDCRPFGTDSECCNGIDDNGDGNVDEVTCFCRNSADCVGVGTFEQVCWNESYSICAPDCRRYGADAFCRMFTPDLPRCSRMTGECIFR